MTTIERTGQARLVALGAVVLAGMACALVVGLLLGPEHRADRGDLVFLAVMVSAGALIWSVTMWAARPARAAQVATRTGTLFGAVGVVANVAFWSGLPLVLGAAAVVLGRVGTSRVATALGWLSVALWLAAYLFVQDFFPALSTAL